MNIVDIKNLNLSFKMEDGIYPALYDVSFSLKKGEMHALVGESGCGKTMTAMSIIKLLPKNSLITSGEIFFNNIDILSSDETQMRKIRGTDIALIPQDPMTSLNPLFTIGDQLAEVIEKDKKISKKDIRKKAEEVLSLVKLPNPKEKLDVYPHELSGGMKQRVIIAMALASDSKVIIADEPTTALDVTIQAQIMKLLNDIKEKYNTSILLITHDLGVVGEYADEISVMYSGRIVENAQKGEFFTNPLHPYTKALMDALPANTTEHVLKTIPGTPPSIKENITGCRFSPRCPYFSRTECCCIPYLTEKRANHFVSCNKV